MPPVVALLLTLLFIGYLFYRDFQQQRTPSLALCIPCLWFLILGSRSVTEWVYLGTPYRGNVIEGSELDRNFFTVLMIAGLVVLSRRQISWSQVFRKNLWITVFFLYCGISVIWSDFPLVALKRWYKALGDPIMILIILTETEPVRAWDIVLRACTNIHIPLSVLFIKYYPHLGRGYSEWTGGAWYTGVTMNKNLLGFLLMICGFSLVWRLVLQRKNKSRSRIDDVGIPVVLLGMVAWLFQMADSKTSLMGLLAGLSVFAVLGIRAVRDRIGTVIVVSALVFVLLQAFFNITALIIESTGRDATLTGRTELWEVVLRMQERPLLGYGFESFWLGDRLKTLQDRWYFRPNQAHSGYIEMYLNLGWIGLFILAGVVLSCYTKIRALLVSKSGEMTEQVYFGRFGMGFLIAYLAYNYTEAAFKSLHFLFLIFLIFAIKYPQPQQVKVRSLSADVSRMAQGSPGIAGVGSRVG